MTAQEVYAESDNPDRYQLIDKIIGGDGDFLAGYLARVPEYKSPGTLWERVAEGADK